MIFDSNEMKTFIAKFKDQRDASVPRIVYLGRSEDMAEERDYLEVLIKLAPESKQKDWLSRLLKEEEAQHIGAWFEMMLYGWLRELGEVCVEPQIEGNYPDFALVVEGQMIVVEATTRVADKALRKRYSLNNEVLRMLNQIERPFLMSIEESTLTTIPESNNFINGVTKWLDSSPDEPFLFQDAKGNVIRLEANKDESLERVRCSGPIDIGFLDPEELKDSLRKKAGQHKAIRNANYPYVIAMMLDSPQLFISQVVSAWFGKEQWILDPDGRRIVESRIDRSGLHFRGSEILHRTVSGTLVFVPIYDKNRQKHFLQAHYIQNPYANVPVSPDLFPAKSKFIVIAQDDSGISMGFQ